MLTTDPDFVPPFCPNPSCRYHHDPTGWTFHADGTHSRKAPPHEVRRFWCPTCGRSFCTQTFDTTYWLKRPELQRPLFNGLVACSGLRQLGRSLSAAPASLQRQTSRLGRHCLLFNQRERPAKPPSEDLVLDGLVSFEFSQFWPFEMNVLVGADTFFTYGFTDSELRRSGRMTAAQKSKRARLEEAHGRPDPQATRKAVEAVVLLAVPVTVPVATPAATPNEVADAAPETRPEAAPEAVPLTIRSDEHRAYPRAFAKLPHRITHHAVSSRRCRTARNPLFAVDLLDLLTRHGSSNHKRETIAFSKRRQAALERMAVLVTWRNFMKRRAEQRKDSPCPAQALGLIAERLGLDQVLYRRIFPSHVPLPPPHDVYYRRRVATRQVPQGTSHRLRYAD